jgi:hypothetical protein
MLADISERHNALHTEFRVVLNSCSYVRYIEIPGKK